MGGTIYRIVLVVISDRMKQGFFFNTSMRVRKHQTTSYGLDSIDEETGMYTAKLFINAVNESSY